MIGLFWHLLSALGGSLPWLEMWCGSNEMLHSRLSRKRGEVFQNNLCNIRQHHSRRTRKIFLRLDWCRQMKVGLRNFTIYWLSNELFSFSSLQEYEIRECFQKSLKGACIYLPCLPRSWQSLNKLWCVLEIFWNNVSRAIKTLNKYAIDMHN